jgi:hypothetical protein
VAQELTQEETDLINRLRSLKQETTRKTALGFLQLTVRVGKLISFKTEIEERQTN